MTNGTISAIIKVFRWGRDERLKRFSAPNEQKKLKKVLDKSNQIWYNKDVKRGKKPTAVAKKIKKILKNLLTNHKRYGIIKAQKDKDSLKNQKGIDIMATKKTQKELYTEILAFVNGNAELTEFVNSRIEALNRKSASKSSAPTAKQKENEVLKTAILNYMVAGERYTIKELIKNVPELAAIEDISNQKVSALLKQMKDIDGTVSRVEEKRVVYFLKA